MSDPVRPGRPEAAAAIWDWKRADDAPGRAASARRAARMRSAVAAAAGAALFYFERTSAAFVAWSLAGLTLALGLASPLGAHAAVDRLVARAGRLVGRAMTVLLLAPVFYLFFAPFGLLFRRGARDPLKRRFEPDATTYWKARREDRPDLERPF
ncbi:MAG TPA: hypothetical protein VIL20_08920 [Sandaracinaceae bacterium]